MRLFEIADKFTDDLETILRNHIGRSDVKRSSASLSYDALSSLMQHLGYGKIDFNSFKKIHDDTPSINSLVKDFNDKGIILGTKTLEKPTTSAIDVPLGGKSVDQMASSAAKDYMRKQSN